MARKIRWITAFLICAVLIACVVSIVIVDGNTINSVKHFQFVESTESSVTLQWKKVRKAQGYNIYSYNYDNGEFEKISQVTDGKKTQFVLDNLDSATLYDFKITAVKSFSNKNLESDFSDEIEAYTYPCALDLVTSPSNAYSFVIAWSTQNDASGYEIEYSKNDDFSDSTSQTYLTNDTNQVVIDDLTAGDVYYSRGRAYIEFKGEKYYGNWSDSQSVTIKEKVIMSSVLDYDKPMIAITFDDGPAFTYKGKNTTSQILDVLEEYNARATFFMVGNRVNSSTASLLQREIELGCELGNHTYSHTKYGSEITKNEIIKACDIIEKYSGQQPTVFRCPGGTITSKIRKTCEEQDMPLVYWSLDTQDWKTKKANKIYKNVIKNVSDGDIILFHDIYPSTATAIKKLVPKLIEEGYQLVTVSELIEAKTGKQAKAGQQYINGNTINNSTK